MWRIRLRPKALRAWNYAGHVEKGERRLDVLEFYWVCHALDVDPASTYSELCASFRACEPRSMRCALK